MRSDANVDDDDDEGGVRSHRAATEEQAEAREKAVMAEKQGQAARGGELRADIVRGFVDSEGRRR